LRERVSSILEQIKAGSPPTNIVTDIEQPQFVES
jgi:hypothetical protein